MNDSLLTEKKPSKKGNSASPPNSMMLSRANMGRIESLLTDDQKKEAAGVIIVLCLNLPHFGKSNHHS